ncbi:MAG TPA: polyprenyl diphosphate synthase [Candidatus Saccharimonadales bacterium]|nr:polyprenyl diphosphate synthase [Candidatus Saccharimonadales bacterium]
MDETVAVIPTHVGFILDGNRRWAKKHSIPEYDGHLAGYNALKEVMDGCFESGIRFVTIYAFSNENWKRDKGEVSGLMKLALQAISKDLKRLIERNVRVRILGRRDGIGAKLLAGFEKCEEKTRHLTGGTLSVCFNYGGQQEIIDAARKCVQDGLAPDQITEEAIAARLYAPEVPPIDMVVRTSGEQRLSNFMLWRTAYSEFLFLQKFWPEMTKDDVTAIINEYSRRQRRFGG